MFFSFATIAILLFGYYKTFYEKGFKKGHDNNIYITIEDSGVGFDPENLPDNGRTHAGIANVRSRLENMCHGRLEIESMIGSGTRVRIILPEYYN